MRVLVEHGHVLVAPLHRVEAFAQILDDQVVVAVSDQLAQRSQLGLLLKLGLGLEVLELVDQLLVEREQGLGVEQVWSGHL